MLGLERATAGLEEPPASRRTGRSIAPIATVGAVAGLAGLVLWSTPAAMVAPWDNFILLDGGYRITERQVPGTDFDNPIGPLTYGLVSLGMWLQQVPSLAAVGYGAVIFLLLASALAWAVARTRLPGWAASGFTIFLGLVVIAVRPLGYSPWALTYAMIYNRYSWVLYATLLLLVLVRPRTDRRPTADGVILGVLLGLLCYCKITYFLAAVVAVGIGLATATLPRRPRLGVAALGGSFSFALGLPPNHGGPLWWDVGINFDRSHYPPASTVFGDVRWVMMPRMAADQGCCQETVAVLLDLYNPYLAKDFTEVERTPDWILLARR